MNLGGLILGFVGVALISGMIVFAVATSSPAVVDANGDTYNSVGNDTNTLVSNVTAVGGTTSGYLVLILAALTLVTGVGLIAMLSRK